MLIDYDYNNASLFIESYLKEWPYYKKNNIEIVANEYKKEKNIQAIGTPELPVRISPLALLKSFV